MAVVTGGRDVRNDSYRRSFAARAGRELTAGERHVDVVEILSALEGGKQRLAGEIRKEQKRLAQRVLDGHTSEEIRVTDGMTAVLSWLHEQGRREARAELARHGITPRRRYARHARRVSHIVSKLSGFLPTISVRTRRRTVEMSLAQEAGSAVLESAARVPGALDAASQLVSSAYYSGMGDVFSDSADLVSGWTHSAILDGGTCDPCEAADGTHYDTWEDAQDDMPDGGPYVDCDGEGRCRCRLVPEGAAEEATGR